MTDKPKLLFHSNSPTTATGYGAQCALFSPHLAEHYDLGISAFYGVEGSPITWNGIPVYPGIGQTYGNECIREHARVHFGGELRGGLTVTLMDVWVLDPLIWRQLDVVSWCPIDHEPCPPPIAEYFHHSGAVPLAMSKFGQEQLKNANLDALYCPHGVDTEKYAPRDKAEAREANKLPADCFLVGMVAANKGNPSRKCFAEALEAFKGLHKRHSDARLYLHTEAQGRFDGVNLPELIDALGIDRSVVYFPDQYRIVHYPFSDERMASLYSAMDVLLAPSAGEGFGLTVLEANACGVPAIVSDFSAQPEVCQAGWLVEGQKWYTPLKSWQFKPSIPDICEALYSAYGLSDAERKRAGEKARKGALNYDAKRVFKEHMLPALKTAQERFQERQPVALEAAA